MISCKDVQEPASGSQRNIMKLVLERTNYEVGSMGIGAGLYMYVVVVVHAFAVSSPDEFLGKHVVTSYSVLLSCNLAKH